MAFLQVKFGMHGMQIFLWPFGTVAQYKDVNIYFLMYLRPWRSIFGLLRCHRPTECSPMQLGIFGKE